MHYKKESMPLVARQMLDCIGMYLALLLACLCVNLSIIQRHLIEPVKDFSIAPCTSGVLYDERLLQIEERAQGGSNECSKFMLTLYRLMAVQIIERLHELFMTTLEGNLDCFRPASMQQSAADTLGLISDTVDSTLPRWRGGHMWRRRTSDAVSAVGGSGGGGRGQGPHARVQSMWTAMRTLLQCASLHVLDPGAEEMMQSSAVLLWGSLVAASDPTVKRLKRSPCTAKAPCALVWAGKEGENATAGVVEVRAGMYATW
jgi:hypothetical protein